MIKEVVMECFVEVMPNIVNMVAESHSLGSVSMIANSPDVPTMTTINRKPIKYVQDAPQNPYGDVVDEVMAPPQMPQTNVKLNNERGVVQTPRGSEYYASGDGILEWYSNQGATQMASEFNHTDEMMNEFIHKNVGNIEQ